MTDGARWRAPAGCLLIVATAPAFFAVAPRFEGLGVIVAGALALAALALGVWLAAGWLGVRRRRIAGDREQPGCLALLMTLVTLLIGAAILYYVIFYGAGAYLGGWNV